MSAKKFLALAMTSLRAKQYEDAGVLFAQAAGAEDAAALIAELTTEPGEIRLDSEPNPDGENTTKDGLVEDGEEADVEQTDVENDPKDGKVSETGPDQELASTPGRDPAVDAVSSESSDEGWGDDEPEESDTISVSSVPRRKTTTLFQIGKILSASMQSLSDDHPEVDDDGESDEDDGDGEDNEGVSPEVDPDYPGQELIQASFSSVRLKDDTVNSLITFKD